MCFKRGNQDSAPLQLVLLRRRVLSSSRLLPTKRARCDFREESWEPLLARVRDDEAVIELQAYKLAMAAYGLVAALALAGSVAATKALL